MIFNGGFQVILQGRDISIETNAYILDIEYQYIHIFQVVGSGFFMIAIEADHRQAGSGVPGIAYFFPGIGIAPEPMLGSEDLHHVDTAFEQGIYQVAVLYHACLVGEYSHCLAFQQGEVYRHSFGAGNNSRLAGRFSGLLSGSNQTCKQVNQ